MADNKNGNRDDEVDLFDLSSGMTPAPSDSRPEFNPLVTETNVLSMEFDAASERKLDPLKPHNPPFTPADEDDDVATFEAAIKPPATETLAAGAFASVGDDNDDDIDDDLSAEKAGFFAKLFGGKPKNAEEFDDDLPELPELPDDDLDDDLPDLPDDDDDTFDLSAAAPAVAQEEEFDLSAAAPAVAQEEEFDLSAAAPAVTQEEEFDLSAAPVVTQEEEFDLSAVTPAPEPEPAVIDLGPDPVFSKIAHVCLYVKNLETSVEFYTKLGLKKRFLFNKDGSRFGIYLEFGKGNFVELFEDADKEYSTGRIAHFCLETPDIDATMESLSKRNIEHTPKKLGCDGTYQTWLTDPDGNRFEIHQYTVESSQIIGRDAEVDW